jgi:hypothetical protein
MRFLLAISALQIHHDRSWLGRLFDRIQPLAGFRRTGEAGD